jgi:hypothetical protein
MKRHLWNEECNCSAGTGVKEDCNAEIDDNLMYVPAVDDAVSQEDEFSENTFLNEFPQRSNFFRCKMAVAYALSLSVVESICSYIQVIFDTHQQHLITVATNSLKMFCEHMRS